MQNLLFVLGGCLFLNKRSLTQLDWYNCTGFTSGCPEQRYSASTVYKCKSFFTVLLFVVWGLSSQLRIFHWMTNGSLLFCRLQIDWVNQLLWCYYSSASNTVSQLLASSFQEVLGIITILFNKSSFELLSGNGSPPLCNIHLSEINDGNYFLLISFICTIFENVPCTDSSVRRREFCMLRIWTLHRFY